MGDELLVQVLAGRNLVAKDSNGFSDPYCKLYLYGDKGKKLTPSSKTPRKDDTLNPVWEASFKFLITQDTVGLAVCVLDYDLLSPDDPMGTVAIELSSIPQNQTVQHWFVLGSSPDCPDAHGEIQLQLTYKTSKASKISNSSFLQAPQTDLVARSHRIENKKKLLLPSGGKLGGRLHVKLLYSPPLGSWPGCLTIWVLEAKDLAGKNLNKKSDPYVVMKVGSVFMKTTVRKNQLSPKWGETFYIPLQKLDEEEFLRLEVWDWNQIADDELIGAAGFALVELEPQKTLDQTVELKSIPSESDFAAKPGLEAKLMGHEPNLPVVLLPGFASSSLLVVESPSESWISERVWLSLEKIGSSRYKNIQNSAQQLGKQLMNEFLGSGKKAETASHSPEDTSFRNKWLEHVCLSEDGISDPPGIKVRAAPGSNGIMYLDPGALTKHLSWVMAPLVHALKDLGYQFDDNLLAAPYDWRLPPFHLEARDGFFSSLKKSIEELVARKNSPAVIVAHSMGNKTGHYFLNWINVQPGGPQWIEKHIHTFIAVGAPWLGAPKMVRSLTTGERMGMEALIEADEGIRFARSLGSTPFLLPVGEKNYFETPGQASFVYIKDKKNLTPMETFTFLKAAGAKKQVELWGKYLSDPLFGPKGNEAILKAPPVKRLYSIYGINLPTEKVYVYRQTSDGSMELTSGDPKIPGIEFPANENITQISKIGIGFETHQTPQRNLEMLTGVKSGRSGDGTVTYESLNYCVFWADQIPNIIVDELPEVEHRDILNNRIFLTKMIEYVSKKDGVEGWNTKCQTSSFNPTLLSVIRNITKEAINKE